MIKKLSLAVALAAIGLSTANAATYNVGDLSALGTEGYYEAVNFNAPSFSDIFNFSISGGTNDFSSFLSKLSLKPSQQLTSFSGTLTGPGSFSQALSYGVGILGGATIQALGWDGQLATGNYSLAINGTAALNGSYTVQLLAAPVPEPESYALLLAGLGLMGTIARRRARNA